MKCIACGEENVQNARFCAFCGARISEETSPASLEASAEASVQEDTVPTVAATVEPDRIQTVHPLSDNPYQPPRSPIIPTVNPPLPTEPEPAQESPSPRRLIKPAPQHVFLFDDEEEEDIVPQQKEAHIQKRVKVAGQEYYEEDEFEEYDEYDEDDEDIYDEEGTPSGGRIFVRIFSILTVLILIAGLVSFMYGTTIGRRLLATAGMSNDAEDYILLADWQLAQGVPADAANSYHNAFKLNPNDYELALTVGTGFENTNDTTRAEQLYSYLIQEYPQADEPFDRLMALLLREGRTEEYASLVQYRSERQADYVPSNEPLSVAPAAPNSNH